MNPTGWRKCWKPHPLSLPFCKVECHPYYQQNALKKRIAPYGTAIECWYPIGHGDSTLIGEPIFTELGKKYGKTNVQIILRWHIQEGNIIFPKTTNPKHMQDNIDIFDFELTDAEMVAIKALDKNKRYFTLGLAEQEAHLSSFCPAASPSGMSSISYRKAGRS